MEAALTSYLALADCGSDEAQRRDEAARAVCDLLRSGRATVLELVLGLEGWLTSTDPANRSAGTKLLVEVLEGAPETLVAAEQLHVMAEFLGARLADWHCAEPAARGCLALVSRTGRTAPSGEALAPLPEADGVSLVHTFAASVQVPPLARPERQACLQLWLALVKAYGVAAALSGTDVADATLAAIDEEKDPRCLLLAFNIVKATAAVYHSPGVDPSPLEQHAEEIVGSLSCYFPVRFTPPKNDPHRITRQLLEESLEAALSCSPFLAKWALPLVLEKLSSTHRPAKEDAMSALVACCRGFGRESMAGHLTQVWSGLRAVLLAPAEPGVAPGEDLNDRRSLAAAAGACLTACLAALGSGTLDRLAVTDLEVGALVKELLTGGGGRAAHGHGHDHAHGHGHGHHAGGGGGGGGTRPRDAGADRAAMCAVWTLAAAAAASPGSCDVVTSELLPLALTALSSSPATAAPSTAAPLTAAPRTLSLSDRQLSALLLTWRLLESVTLAAGSAPAQGAGAAAGAKAGGGWGSCQLAQQLPAVVPAVVGFSSALQARQGRRRAEGEGKGEGAEEDGGLGGGPGQEAVEEQAQVLCCYALKQAAAAALKLGGTWGRAQAGVGGGGGAGSGAGASGAEPTTMEVDVGTGVTQVGAEDASAMPGAMGWNLEEAAARLLLGWALDTGGTEETLGVDPWSTLSAAMSAGAPGEGGSGSGAGAVPSAAVEVWMEWGRSAAVQQEATESLIAIMDLASRPTGPAPGDGQGPERQEQGTGAGVGPGFGGLGGLQEQVLRELMEPLLPPAAAATTDPASHASTMEVDGAGAAVTAAGVTAAAEVAAAQALAVTAQLARRGPAGLAWQLVGSWRQPVLRSLAALGGGSGGDVAGGPTRGGTFSTPILCGVLNCLAASILPACTSTHQPSQQPRPQPQAPTHPTEPWQATSAAFASSLLEGLSKAAPGALPDGVAWAAAACVAQLMALCSERQQSEIAAVAAATLQTTNLPTDPPADAGTGAGAGAPGLPLGAAALPAACAALAALSASAAGGLLEDWPAPGPGQAELDRGAGEGRGSPQTLVLTLVRLAVSQNPGCAPLVQPACVALASLVNKAPGQPKGQGVGGVEKCGVDGLVGLVLDGPTGLLATAASSARSMGVVAWVCNALSMRGHARASDLVDLALQVLTRQQQPPASGQQPTPPAAACGQHLTPGSVGQAGVASHGGDAGDVAAAAAELFAIAVSGSQVADKGATTTAAASGGGATAATAGLRVGSPVARPLWQQRTLSTCLGRTLEAAEQLQQPSPGQPEAAAGAGAALGPLLALCHLVSAAPSTLVRGALIAAPPRLATALVAALGAVSVAEGQAAGADLAPAPHPAGHTAAPAGSRASAGAAAAGRLGGAVCRRHGPAVLGAIRSLQGLLEPPAAVSGTAPAGAAGGAPAAQQAEAPGRSLLEPQAGPLVSALCGLALSPGSAAVREAALRCLVAVMEGLPYHALHPLRQLVLTKTIPLALDDPKRGVRKAAITCRRAWSIK